MRASVTNGRQSEVGLWLAIGLILAGLIFGAVGCAAPKGDVWPSQDPAFTEWLISQ